MDSEIPTELQQLADAYGVMTSFDDAFGRRRIASVDTLIAVLGSLGVEIPSMAAVPAALEAHRSAARDRRIEPVLVAWGSHPLSFDLTLPAELSGATFQGVLESEHEGDAADLPLSLQRESASTSGCGRWVTLRLRAPQRLPWGYYRLRVEAQSFAAWSLVIVAPEHAYTPEPVAGTASEVEREWGCFLPLYAIRNERNWGAGDLTDLRRLMQWTAASGGSLVGTLPLLGSFLDEPCDPSPYSPASRMAWNEFYVDVTSIPEFGACKSATDLVQSAPFAAQLDQLRQTSHVDYRKLMAVKRQVLEVIADAFFQSASSTRRAAFEHFLRQHPHVEGYAEFRAIHERQGQTWQHWPSRLRGHDVTSDDYDLRCKQYHLYAQWVTTEQLDQLAEAAGGGLYLDLPLGVRPDGYDVWKWNDVYANTASAGSPPEIMWTSGQDWGFPPLHPLKIREQGYRHVRDYLAHHLRLSRLLRIDHVMQLHRLYWIPHGISKANGTYVRYRAEELHAILNLESHRWQAALVGENLGTVPPEVNRSLDRHHLKRMYVAQYEIASSDQSAAGSDGQHIAGLRDVPERALACLNTHDMPTFAAWWQGDDIDLRQKVGLLSEPDAAKERSDLAATKTQLIEWFHQTGQLESPDPDAAAVLSAFLKFIASSPADAVLVNLEDLWLETEPHNVPGTGAELPNWTRKARRTFEAFSQDPQVLEILRAINERRRVAAPRS